MATKSRKSGRSSKKRRTWRTPRNTVPRKAAKKTKKAKRKKGRRTVLYSSKGKKLYAKRDKAGKFKDIQSYQRAHSMDIKRDSKDELAYARSHPGVAPPPKAR